MAPVPPLEQDKCLLQEAIGSVDVSTEKTFLSPALGILLSDGAKFYQQNFLTWMLPTLSSGHQ